MYIQKSVYTKICIYINLYIQKAVYTKICIYKNLYLQKSVYTKNCIYRSVYNKMKYNQKSIKLILVKFHIITAVEMLNHFSKVPLH